MSVVFPSAHQKLGPELPLPFRLDHVTPAVFELISCSRCSSIPEPDHFYLCETCQVYICKDCFLLGGFNPCNLSLDKLSLNGNGEAVEAVSSSEPARCVCDYSKLRRAFPKVLQLLLEMTSLTCENSERGCNQVIPWAKLDKHSKDCE